MKWILWSNTIIEGSVAIGMVLAPASFFPGAEGLSAAIARAFSFAILTIAFISFSVTRKGTSPETLKNGVVLLTFYHVFQLIVQLVNARMYPPILMPPVVIHVVFSALFIFSLTRLKRAEPA